MPNMGRTPTTNMFSHKIEGLEDDVPFHFKAIFRFHLSLLEEYSNRFLSSMEKKWCNRVESDKRF